MDQLSPSTMLAVLDELFGTPVIVLMVLAAAVFVAAFVYVLIRERRVRPGRAIRAELFAVLGGVTAILFVQAFTHSSLDDLGGPIDIIVITMIWLVGTAGTFVAAYAIQGLWRLRRGA